MLGQDLRSRLQVAGAERRRVSSFNEETWRTRRCVSSSNRAFSSAAAV
jgi:hypothetical protein